MTNSAASAEAIPGFATRRRLCPAHGERGVLQEGNQAMIATVSRVILPGAKCASFAYGASGEFLVGLPVQPKRVARWMQQGATSQDRQRLGVALAEHLAETEGGTA